MGFKREKKFYSCFFYHIIRSEGQSKTFQVKYGYYSTNNLFFNHGEYRFDINKLSQNHQLNLSLFIEALARAEPVVICDNTNVCHWEYLAYKTAAVALGYQVKVVLIGDPKSVEHQELCSQRNKHSVSLKQIQRMAKLFEID